MARSDVQFNRVYKLQIFSLGGSPQPLLTIDNSSQIKLANGLKFKSSFSTEGTGSKNNRVTASLYNLTKAQIKAFHDGKDGRFELSAGYAHYGSRVKPLRKIYTGDIKFVKTRKTDDDVITEITLEAGAVMKQLARVSQEFKGKSIEEVAKGLGDSLVQAYSQKLPTAPTGFQVKLNLDPAIGKVILPRRLVYEGRADKSLDAFCKDYKLNWMIYLDTIYIYSEGFTPSDKPVKYEITPDTVINSLEEVNTAVKTKLKTTDGDKDLTFTSFLTADIVPDTIVIVSKDFNTPSSTYSGDYKVVSVEYNLDYRGVSWTVTAHIRQKKSEDTANAV